MAVEDIRDSVSSARQELFPELVDDVVLDIEEDPFADAETDEEASSDTTGGDEADVETEAGEVVEQ